MFISLQLESVVTFLFFFVKHKIKRRSKTTTRTSTYTELQYISHFDHHHVLDESTAISFPFISHPCTCIWCTQGSQNYMRNEIYAKYCWKRETNVWYVNLSFHSPSLPFAVATCNVSHTKYMTCSINNVQIL